MCQDYEPFIFHFIFHLESSSRALSRENNNFQVESSVIFVNRLSLNRKKSKERNRNQINGNQQVIIKIIKKKNLKIVECCTNRCMVKGN